MSIGLHLQELQRWCRVLWTLIAISAGLFCSETFAAEPLPLAAYGQLPAIDSLTLSPSGSRLAYFGIADDKQALIVSGSDGSAVGAWNLGDLKLRGISWVTDELLVVRISGVLNDDDDGDQVELQRHVVVDLAKGTMNPLLKAGKTFGIVVEDHGYRWMADRWYAIVSAEGRSFGHQLERVDLQTLESQKIGIGNDFYSQLLPGDQGQIVAHAEYSPISAIWHLYAGPEVGQELVRVKDATETSKLHGHGRTVDSVLYSLQSDGGERRYFEASLTESDSPAPPTELLANQVEPVEFVHDRVTRLLKGYQRLGDHAELHFFDASLQSRIDGIRKAFGKLQLSFCSWSDDYTRFAVMSHGDQDAGTYWFVDLKAQRVAKLGSAYPKVQPEQVAPIRMVDYKASDGLALHGVLTLPPGRDPKRLPLIVLPHGGPEARSYPEFDWWPQAMASQGYAVFEPNFRGSSGYGEWFVRLGDGETGRKMQTDVSDGVAELVRMGIIDASRVCIVGASYGGYMALAGVTVQQGLYRCAVSVAGVSDLNGMINDGRTPLQRLWKRRLGVLRADDPQLKPLSPVQLAARADAPILLMYGTEDTAVGTGQSTVMLKALKKAGKPVESVVLKDEDHWLSRGATRLEMLEASVAFIEKHNPAVVPAAEPAR